MLRGRLQTREVVCLRGVDHAIMDASACAGLETPISVRACNLAECQPSAYSWAAQEWGACDATCGGGTKHRVVVCQRKNGTADTSEAACASVPKDYVPTHTPCNTKVSVYENKKTTHQKSMKT